MKSLNVIKAAVRRWLSHGAACKRCRERYGMILGSLDDIITRNPRPELIDYCDEMLNEVSHYCWKTSLRNGTRKEVKL